jgi:hypothetical protein
MGFSSSWEHSEEVSYSYSYVYSVELGLRGIFLLGFDLGLWLGFKLGLNPFFELSPIVIIPDIPQSGVPV